MRRLGLVFAVALVGFCCSTPARAAGDPKLLWRSIETAHFRVSYYSTEDEIARHVATLAEGIYTRLSPAVGWTQSERTEIVVTDQTDSANGLSIAIPYNAIALNATAPDDMSPLGDVDDWYLELVTHEYTHIVHTDHISGIPALVNRILGKTWAPNQLEPRWMLEGLAVFEESARTSGGRLRSSMWNMFMRADVLEDNVAPLDVFSDTPRRWPQANIWYLYGSFFMQWIAETYGEQAIRAMIDDYSRQIVPYAINRSVRRATGRTFEELYPAWIESMGRTFAAQAEAIRARGIRQGVRLTRGGNMAQRPRWAPDNAWTDHRGDLVYFRDDGHGVGGIWALPLERDGGGAVILPREDRRELLIRTNGASATSFMPDGAAIFSSADVHDNLYLFDDLFELPAHDKSPGGLDGRRVRWTDGFRALDPSISPDGRRVVFTTNHRGTTYLMIADVVASATRPGAHEIAGMRGLVPSALFDQAFTPRWAPDNRHVAYGAWRRGGFRDIRIVDVVDGSVLDVTGDRAIDGDPVFSPDGRWLYFHSDRSGVTNIYAYEVATRRLMQVTNVVNGAYQPEPSPDGKWIAYVGYTHAGFDIFLMAVEPERWLDPVAPSDTRPAPMSRPPPVAVTARVYDPLRTLLPRDYSVRFTPGNFGQATVITASGNDIAGLHSLGANLTSEWEHPELQGAIGYRYGRLPFDFAISAYRSIAPGGGYRLGGMAVPWVAETAGATADLRYAMPRAFDGQSFEMSYTFARVGGTLPLPSDRLSPYETPSLPFRGFVGSLHLGWSYSNAIGTLWSVGAEQGFSVGTGVDVSDQILASDLSGYAVKADFMAYFKMPWLRHHVVALHVGGGASGGDHAGQGSFYVGGFVDYPIIDTLRSYIVQAGWLVLRGYPVAFETGAYFGLLNAEYRFPIVNVDRGPSTLPLFLHRISGAAFLDCGSAFDSTVDASVKTGAGAELWLDMTLGYVVDFTFRGGYAKGLSTGGIDKAYFVAVYAF